MLRATFPLLPLLFLTGCPDSASKDAPASSASAPAAKSSATGGGSLKPGSAMANATASASASSVAVGSGAPGGSAGPVGSAAKAGACAALVAWDKDGNAKATTAKGKIGNGEGQNGRAETEKFQTLVFDKPVCGPDKAPVDEAQLYTNDKTIDLEKMVGKTVTIEGEPFTAHTAHHHRPIVIEVKKLSAN